LVGALAAVAVGMAEVIALMTASTPCLGLRVDRHLLTWKSYRDWASIM
jgi:hypothetical protein